MIAKHEAASNSESFFLLRNVHSSSLFSIWRLRRRTNRCYLVQCWEVRRDIHDGNILQIAVTDLYLDIEVDDIDEDVNRSYYSVKLYVEDLKVAKSKKSKLQSSVVKLEWEKNDRL